MFFYYFSIIVIDYLLSMIESEWYTEKGSDYFDRYYKCSEN